MTQRRHLAIGLPLVALALAGCSAPQEPTVDDVIDAADVLRAGGHGEPLVEPRLGRGVEILEFEPQEGEWGVHVRCLGPDVEVGFSVNGEDVERQPCDDGMIGLGGTADAAETVYLGVDTDPDVYWVALVAQP